jgi:hypothetical protein
VDDDEQRAWLAGQDYERAAELNAAKVHEAMAPPDGVPVPDPVEAMRHELLGDVWYPKPEPGGLLERLATGRFEDDDPPGAPR